MNVLNSNFLMSRWLIIFGLGLLLSSCGIFKPGDQTSKKRLHAKKQQLLSSISENKVDYRQLTIKYSADYKDIKNSYNLKGTIKIIADSVFYLTASPGFGIEAARMKITKDSVFILNRLKSEYIKTDFKYLQNKVGFDLDFQNLESIFLNRAFSVLGEQISDFSKHSFSIDSTAYRFLLKNEQYSETLQFSQALNFIAYFFTEKKGENRNLLLYYSDFQDTEKGKLPRIIKLKTTGNEAIDLNFKYKTIDFASPVSIRFSVPSRYTVKVYR